MVDGRAQALVGLGLATPLPEGECRFAFLWLHNRSRSKRSCFVPYIVDA